MESILIIGALAGAYWLWSKASHGSNLVFYPHKISSITFDGFNPILNADIYIQNASNTAFTIDSLAGNVYANDTLVGNVSNFSQQQIPANSQISYPVTFRLNPIGLVDTIVSAIQNQSTPVTLVVDAKANAEGVQLSVPMEFKINQ
jgi:LEA14-like dessication related protein